MGFQLSPGVVTSEIDLTTVVPAVSTTTGAFGGVFNWGPTEFPVQVVNETKLVEFFGKPDSNTAISFFTCANFLSYGNDLRVVRAVNSNIIGGVANSFAVVTAVSPVSPVSPQTSNVCIKNDEQYFNNYYSSNGNYTSAWAARYPGSKGNSLKVSVWANSDSSLFSSWKYASLFTGAPGTSVYANNIVAGCNDEIHIVVVDEDGAFTGTANAVLETYPFVSKASDAKDSLGNLNYYKNVIYTKSRYIHSVDSPDAQNTAATWGKTVSAVSGQFAQIINNSSIYELALSKGTDGNPTANVVNAYSQFTNADKIDISLVMMGDASPATVLYAISNIAEARKDCVVFVSPTLANCQSSSAATAITNYRYNALSNVSTSYAVMDGNWKYQYDKYNDVYRWLPMNGDIAGLCARTDQTRDAWWSPAGLTRGNIKNVVKLAYYPESSEKDTLYKAGVNPVVSQPGTGTILFGDKTMLVKPSAFDRINVRRLFIVLEKAIAIAAKSSLFEFNDEFTRASFKSIVEPFLRTVKGRRGIYDFRVVCDTTNNTPDIIDANQFVGDIYVKPARSINFIQLNFVAVRTGVSFDEVVGKF
jgi:phage tail sheath protein FI